MTSLRLRFAMAALAFMLGGSAWAEPGDVYDASGRLVESVDADGIRVQYIYNADGVLVEERYSDGRRVSHEPLSESGSEAPETRSED